MSDKQRIIDLQAQVLIARRSLERIKAGAKFPDAVAEVALDALFQLDQKQPLQGLVGHERRKPQ